MSRFLAEVFARHRSLGWVGAFNLAAAAVFLPLMLVDQTTVLGIDRWIKPFKFGVSVGLLLFMQAFRGTRSHFNTDTAFDGVVFGMMGILILLNSILLVVLFLLFVFRAADAPRPWIWAIRIGLLLLLLGSLEGAYMIGNGGHSVGARDGGEGLPLIHWNTGAGDLRPAHLIGLHGIQVIPLFAFLLGRLRLTQVRQLLLVFAFSGAYALLGGILFWQAARGMPLLG